MVRAQNTDLSRSRPHRPVAPRRSAGLASDVLRSAIAPSFEELGKLAAVAAIRTALNFFLAREIAEEQTTLDEVRAGRASPESLPP